LVDVLEEHVAFIFRIEQSAKEETSRQQVELCSPLKVEVICSSKILSDFK
jgi:hypothetical protein